MFAKIKLKPVRCNLSSAIPQPVTINKTNQHTQFEQAEKAGDGQATKRRASRQDVQSAQPVDRHGAFCFSACSHGGESPFPACSGKDRQMKTPKEFAYDLWVAEDGQYMVRIKATKEVCAVDQAVFRALRAEEKHLRREMEGVPTMQVDEDGETIRAAMLSTDFVHVEDGEDLDPWWLADPDDFIERLQLKEAVQELCAQLTERQLEIFKECMIRGLSLTEFALNEGISPHTVWKIQKAIQKKFEKIWGRGVKNAKKMSV